MSLRKEIADYRPSVRPNLYERILSKLPVTDAKELSAAMDDDSVSTQSIHHALTARGFSVSVQGLANVRNKRRAAK